MPTITDITGQRFSRLVAQWTAGFKDRKALWLCLCDCGNSKIVLGKSLRNGSIRSCGCLHREELSLRSTTHGHTQQRKHSGTYSSWSSMIQRCTNPNNKRWADYGGRGIKVCDRWLTFENFLADMGEKPESKTLDRYPDNDGNYELENCRWASTSEQGKNRRMTEKRLAACLANIGQ